MAFALALQSVHDLPEGHGQTIFTATTAIVVLTVCSLACYLVYQKPYRCSSFMGMMHDQHPLWVEINPM